jgi:hypothetical protein
LTTDAAGIRAPIGNVPWPMALSCFVGRVIAADAHPSTPADKEVASALPALGDGQNRKPILGTCHRSSLAYGRIAKPQFT